MGDERILSLIFRSFADTMPGLLDELTEAARANNADAVRCLAHAIKGAAGMLTAEKTRSLAEALESLGREQRHDEIDQ